MIKCLEIWNNIKIHMYAPLINAVTYSMYIVFTCTFICKIEISKFLLIMKYISVCKFQRESCLEKHVCFIFGFFCSLVFFLSVP